VEAYAELKLWLSPEMAHRYDEVFDTYNQDEEKFSHAALRALATLMESQDDLLKTEILNAVSDFFEEACDQEPPEEVERIVFLDSPTYQWTEMLAGRMEIEPEFVFFVSVIALSEMMSIIKRQPDASLRTYPTTTFLRHIITKTPQSLN
jgi:hypothetical protein